MMEKMPEKIKTSPVDSDPNSAKSVSCKKGTGMDSLIKSRVIETVCGLSLKEDFQKAPSEAASQPSDLENSVCQESPQWLTELSEKITDNHENQRIQIKLEKYKIKSARLFAIEQERIKYWELRWKTAQQLISCTTLILAMLISFYFFGLIAFFPACLLAGTKIFSNICHV